METGIELIVKERKRQIDEEGWTAQHDDQHTNFQLLCAAVCYCMASSSSILGTYWPVSWDKKWWKPTTYIRNLTKAGALIAAEIDRLQRLEGK